MLERIFLALSGVAALKKSLWHAWYSLLARVQPSREWTFMNYGYVESGPQTLILSDDDEPDRGWIQLYHHVAGAIDLKGANVLEVGSGRGGGASFIKRYLKPDRMTGMDLAKSAVDFSRSRHRVEGLDFRVGDAERIPFDDNSFDAVANVESSHCYPSLERFLAEVRRVLRPGGYFLYADFREADNVAAWKETLHHSALAILRERDITPNVTSALIRDNQRKLNLIHRLIPRILRRYFFDFAAVQGSTLFEAFRTGKVVYLSFVLQKPGYYRP
jgi:ubiquinone/menaquinone biosynthesis C-methylase UbiE